MQHFHHSRLGCLWIADISKGEEDSSKHKENRSRLQDFRGSGAESRGEILLDALNKELEEALERGEENGTEEDIEEFTYIKNNLYYLKENRIEINSITVRLNDNAKFWNWIEDKQRFWFPDRDFTRSANVPEYVEPDELQELNNVIRQKGTAALEPQREELQEKLRNNNIKNAFLFDRTNKIKPDYDLTITMRR